MPARRCQPAGHPPALLCQWSGVVRKSKLHVAIVREVVKARFAVVGYEFAVAVNVAVQDSAGFVVPQFVVDVLEKLILVDLIAVGVLAWSVPSVLLVWVGRQIDVLVLYF